MEKKRNGAREENEPMGGGGVLYSNVSDDITDEN
jgi:hypothetical protein